METMSIGHNKLIGAIESKYAFHATNYIIMPLAYVGAVLVKELASLSSKVATAAFRSCIPENHLLPEIYE